MFFFFLFITHSKTCMKFTKIVLLFGVFNLKCAHIHKVCVRSDPVWSVRFLAILVSSLEIGVGFVPFLPKVSFLHNAGCSHIREMFLNAALNKNQIYLFSPILDNTVCAITIALCISALSSVMLDYAFYNHSGAHSHCDIVPDTVWKVSVQAQTSDHFLNIHYMQQSNLSDSELCLLYTVNAFFFLSF